MLKNHLSGNFLLILVSLIPVSVILGPSISLINIILISFCFLFYYRKKNFFSIFRNKTIIYLLIIYFYFLLNSLNSIDYSNGFARNLGFFRFILLFFAINYLFSNNSNTNLVFKFWFVVTFIVLLDIFFEFFIGKNILGYSESSGSRIVSFLKDEAVVAGYLNGFIFIIFGFFFSKFDQKSINQKYYIYLILLSYFICIMVTGERSNTLKFLFGITVFLSLNHFIKYKHKLLFGFFGIFIISVSLISSERIKLRYGDQLINLYVLPLIGMEYRVEQDNKENIYFKDNLYIQHYKSGIEVFKKYPLLGVGNKNYRIEACENNLENKYLCNTHPHQIYLELLSEHGLLGSLLLLSIIFYLIFKNFKMMIKSNNLIQLGSFSFLLTNFLPLLPSGSFFGDFNATLFWLNFSIFYASNPETNVFKNGGLAQ